MRMRGFIGMNKPAYTHKEDKKWLLKLKKIPQADYLSLK